MNRSMLAKGLGWCGAFLVYAQQAVTNQSALPHGARGWLSLAGSIVVGFAIHHAASTDGTR
jgi:hypothetical protein